MIKHYHKYKRVNLGNNYLVYKCMEPSCSHYTRVELTEGKYVACNRCGEVMIMTKKAMTLARPHCEACTKSKPDEVINKIEGLLNDYPTG